jgi:hypothetical protein
MSIASVRTQLAALQLRIAGIKQSYPNAAVPGLPRGAINDMDLPLFLNFVREAPHDYRTDGETFDLEVRTYVMQLLVAPVNLQEPGEGENATTLLIDPVMDFFRARPRLEMDGVWRAIITRDTGARSNLVWANVNYWGCEFTLQVSEIIPITFAPGE